MNYFVLFYSAVADARHTCFGKAMKATEGTVLMEGEIASIIEAEYRDMSPSVGSLDISVLKAWRQRPRNMTAFQDRLDNLPSWRSPY